MLYIFFLRHNHACVNTRKVWLIGWKEDTPWWEGEIDRRRMWAYFRWKSVENLHVKKRKMKRLNNSDDDDDKKKKHWKALMLSLFGFYQLITHIYLTAYLSCLSRQAMKHRQRKMKKKRKKVLFNRIKMPFHPRHSLLLHVTSVIHIMGREEEIIRSALIGAQATHTFPMMRSSYVVSHSLDDFIMQIAWKNSSLFFSLLAAKIKFFNCLLWLRVCTCMRCSTKGEAKKYQIAAAAAAAGLAAFSAAPKKLKV